jgi:hypothetical protein
MTVVARRIKATPERSASSAWSVIVNLLAPATNSTARSELESVAGIASSLISDEAFKDSPAVVYGNGPRVRLYCLYDEEAISGENVSESAFSFLPTEGDWKISLPCPADDLNWVQGALAKTTSRVTARDLTASVGNDEEGEASQSAQSLTIDVEAFLNT